MNSVDSKKSKKRKNRRGTKSTTTPNQVQVSISQPGSNTTLKPEEIDEMKEIEKLMDGDDDSDTPIPPMSRGPNPYLGEERCLLCRCERPSHLKEEENNEQEKNEDDKSNTAGFTQLPLWVCPDCRKSVEEEEKKAGIGGSLMNHDPLGIDANLPFLPDLPLSSAAEPTTPNGTLCTCEACTERRQIESEHQKETQELQQCWMELRHVVRCVYRQAGTGLEESGKDSDDNEIIPDIVKMKELVHRLCSRDPHQLFQRLESQGREYVIEMKVRLLKQLNQGHKTPPQAKQFVAMLLEEYSNLCKAAKMLAAFFTELETEHLKRFNLTWELHNKHLFHSIIYSDPLVQNSLPMLITQLRLGAASKESYHEETYPNTLHNYLKFDNELSVVSVVWRDCHTHIEEYNEEQAALKAKQKMLKEDWEFFKAQRKLLEQQYAKTNNKASVHSLETQFTETMRHLLQGTKPAPAGAGDMHVECPNCHRKRCPCDECTISHMITCGIISPEVSEGIQPHHHPLYDPSRYMIDVSPPSMSSTSSSSGASSPIMVDPERLTLPFEENQNSDNEEYVEASESQEDQHQEPSTECCDENTGKIEHTKNILEDLASSDQKPQEPCDCSHCAVHVKVKTLEEIQMETLQYEQQDMEPISQENQCQCHVCLGKGFATTLPQHPSPITTTPAALHLYPHIHGSHDAMLRPFLHPQLYDLHRPTLGHHQPKPIIQPQKKQALNLNLDLDSQEALHEHIYNAYGDWDNVMDGTLPNSNFILNSHKYGGSLGSELMNTPPPPPLSYASTGMYMNDQALPTGGMADVVTSTAKAGYNHLHPSTEKSGLQLALEKEAAMRKNLKPINRTLLNQSPNHAGQTSATKHDHPPDHCLKHAHLSHVNHTSIASSTHTSVSASTPAQPLPMKLTPDILRSAAINAAKEEAARASSNSLLGGVGNFNLNPPHACNHLHNNLNQVGNKPYQTSGLIDPNHGVCASSVSLPSSVNNVSVGTSTMCTDPDCDGHHDDNYDSVDDSCSEQSSSNSTSNNQKDGKYCDCCYCEFFGHGNPPVAPTSKNYAEMRDRLRLRLKRKKETEGGEPYDAITNHEHELTKEYHHSHGRKIEEDPMARIGLEELVKFINGEEGRNGEKQLSGKAAKRARQKQRKAEEKARKEAEEARRKELERLEQLRRQQLLEQQQLEQQKQQQLQSRKKKGKHKENVSKEAGQPNPAQIQSNNHKMEVNGGIAQKQNNKTRPAERNNPDINQDARNKKTKPLQTAKVNGSIDNRTSPVKDEKPGKREQQSIQQSKQPSKLQKEAEKQKQGSVDAKKTTPLSSTKNHVQQKQPTNISTTKVPTDNGPKPQKPSQQVTSNGTDKGSKVSIQQVQKNTKAETSPSNNQQQGKAKTKKKKNKPATSGTSIDEIFMPKQDLDLDNGEMDEFEKELEEFKRFCFTSTPPPQRAKLQVNVNLKDIMAKKKANPVSCS